MQRRNFSQALLAGGGLAVAGTLGWGTAQAQVAGLKEGTDYLRLARPAPVDSAAGQVEVVEFFAYTCIHCYNFEPHITEWLKKKPAHVTLRRIPVAFSDAFLPLQRLYYALEAMGQVDALHDKVFKAIHIDKQRITTPDAITNWVEKQGVDRAKFTEFYNSFAVAGKARRATQLQEAYQVEGTPALGVAGRFYIPGQGARTLAVANALIAEVRKG
ncbi:MAG: disulfide bond formation protein DsbA [Betaproteobacteria bacterium HGW-Betaproteobacteria-16]|nr:MAG: disulfide bond formation protein DsbA [Betaproteobacteria bacterium HGW-Betaproteobacteria-16]